MKKIYSLAIVIAFISFFGQVNAQWNYQSANAQNVAGTYTDLGALGSAITTNYTAGAMTFDDDNSSIQNIGFTFNFNGLPFTQFVLNSNGFIKLGNLAPSATNIYYTAAQATNVTAGSCITVADANLIYAMNHDLGPATSGGSPEYRVYTSGTVGSRICTIQFKNLADKIGGTLIQFNNINFQIQLFEGSNEIDFVYGPWTISANPTNFIGNAIGIKGTATANSVNITKGSTQDWSLGTFLDGNYTGNTHNIRNTVLVNEPGRTYKFFPTYANDAAISAVYTLGKLPIPYATPHIVSASIKNTGTNTLTNLAVSLSITGANSFSPAAQNIASLAPGASATVSFAGFTPTVTGTNNVTISIPADDNTSNNSSTVSQTVSNNAYSYAYGTVASGGVGFTGNTGDFVAKFNTNAPTTVNQVSVNFAAGGQPFQVGIWDASGAGGTPGTNLWTSTSQTSTVGTFTLPVSPAVAVSGDFYVGVRQIGTANVSFAFQNESPIRPTTFYYTSPTGGTTWTDFSPNSPYRFMVEPRLTLANDVGASSITNPIAGSTVGICNLIPKCNISNYGSANQSFNATFQIKQGASVVYTSTKPVVLNAGVTQLVTFDPGSVPAGAYTANCFTSLAGDADPTNDLVTNTFTAAIVDYGGGAPANGNYSFLNSTACAAAASPVPAVYNWVTQTTNEINWGLNGDDSTWITPITLPFTFPYFGNNYTQLWVNSNGWISFTDPAGLTQPTQRTPVVIPTAGGIENYIAGALTDFDVTTATYSDAHTYYGGDATQYVITYKHAHAFGSATDFITFQIILRPNGKIIIQYDDGQSTSPVPTSITNTCAVGIENSTGSAGIQYRLAGSGGPMFGSPLALEFRPAGVVPINLLNFTAQRSGKINLLNWSTSQEQNSSHFIVERSNDSRSFTSIGQVTATGFSTTVSNYSFTDNNPAKGINYYRLRSVDRDNVAKYSLVRSVRNDGIADVAVYPNPVIDILKVSVSADKNVTGEIQISDVSGKVLYTKQVKIVQGNNTLPVNVANFAAGTYMIKVQLGDDIVVNKFTKL